MTYTKILCIDTAVLGCSVALFDRNTLLHNCESTAKNIAAEALNEYIDIVMKESNCTYSQLSAIAISGGPGSYTGLRIGTATAKGLCYALKVPLIHIDTTAIMAAAIHGDSYDYIITLIDARRNDVFYAVYDQQLHVVAPIGFMTLSQQFFTKYTNNKSIIVGDGADKATAYSNIEHDSSIMPSAKNMGAMALQKYINNDFEDVAYYEPRYHKDFYTTMQTLAR